MFRNQLPFDNFRILEVGSIDNQDKFNLQDFVNDLNLEEVLINIIGEINKNLSEVKSFIIEESDNITM